jgi:hypothetical protein
VTVNNAVLQPPPFLGSGLPAGCYRATVSATAQLPNTPNFVSQGAGSSQTCFTDPPPPPPPPPDPDPSPGGGCIDNCDGGTQNATGAGSEPLLINFSGPYKLSDLDDPVVFDINATGQAKTIGWTARGSDEAFLAFDRNGNGQIDDGSELFGNATPLTQGGRAQMVLRRSPSTTRTAMASSTRPIRSGVLYCCGSMRIIMACRSRASCVRSAAPRLPRSRPATTGAAAAINSGIGSASKVNSTKENARRRFMTFSS